MLLDEGLAVGIQDLGGAGLVCATSETASRGGVGMDVDVNAVSVREPSMEPFEIMTSESQERMLAIVEPANLARVLEICERWDVRASVVGRVTEGGALRIRDGFDGPILAEVPAASLHDAAPLYDRPMDASPATGTDHTEGVLVGDAQLAIVAESDRLVLFGDGIESDAVSLTWGQRLTVGLSGRRLRLL